MAEPRYLEGWPAVTGSYHDSSPAVADVDGDGRREVAVVAWDGRFHLFDSRGRPVPGFPAITGARSGERSSPVMADLDGDKKLELLFGSADGRLYALDRKGSPLPGWPRELAAVPAGPAVQDFTSYRGLEVFAAAGKYVYGLHANGTAIGGWPARLSEEASGPPAVGDLDGDRRPEVIVASGAEVSAFTTSGALAPGWPVTLDAKVACAPTLADVNGDGRTEVLLGTAAGSAYVLEWDGSVRAGWPQPLGPNPITAPAAVGDLDGRGELTLVFVGGATHLRGATLGAFTADGRPRPGFPKHVSRTIAAAPLLADVDGDGFPEILVVTYHGSLIAFEKTGAVTSGFPSKLRGSGVTSTPAVSDVDDDGFTDIVVASQDGYLEVFAADSAYEPTAHPWPMYAGNHWRTGKYLGAAAKRQTFALSVRSGGVYLRWRAEPRDDRLGWTIQKGLKDFVTGKVLYYELAAVEEQPTSSYSYRDEQVEEGAVYYYKLEERFTSGKVHTYGPKAIRAAGGAAHAASAITRCYPNPFTAQISIAYEVGGSENETTTTTISIYDISGKLIRNLVHENKTPGKYIAEWDGTDAGGAPVASGVYLTTLRAGKDSPPSSKTIVLIR
jgi:hypothetical protein